MTAKPEANETRTHDALIAPIMTAEEAQEKWQEFRKLENTVLQEDDYIYFVEYKTGQKANSVVYARKVDAEKLQRDLEFQHINATMVRRKTKSAYRKMARFFGLFVPEQAVADVSITPLGVNHFVQIEKGNGVTIITYLDEGLRTIKVEVTVAITAPSGKTSIGVGTCALDERRFTHPDHDVRATAWTRAINRGVSDLVGWGEVSAEELLDGGEPGPARKDVIEGTARVVAEQKMTLASFLAEAFKLGWKINEIEAAVGNLNNIVDYAAFLEELKKSNRNPLLSIVTIPEVVAPKELTTRSWDDG